MNDWSEEMAEYTIPCELQVTIGWMGEGWCGDYDEDDPTDEPLLRFDAYDLKCADPDNDRRSRSYQDTSYCTALPATTSLPQVEAVCKAIAEALAGKPHWKRICEGWSWVDGRKALELFEKRREET